MKNSKCCPLIIIASLIIGFIVYSFLSGTNFDTSYFTLFLITTIATGVLSVLTLLISYTISCRSKAIACAFSGCGNTAVTSGALLVVLSLLTWFLEPLRNIPFYVGISLCFSLLSILMGSIACFLYTYNSNLLGSECGCTCTDEKNCLYLNVYQEKSGNTSCR